MIQQILGLLYNLLFFLTPLIMYGKTSELFEFNKMIWIYFCSVSVAMILMLQWVLTRKVPLKRTFLDIPILIFFVSQAVSTLFSIDLHTSFFGYYGRFNGGLWSIIAFIVLYYGFVYFLSLVENKKSAVFQILQVSLLSSLFSILWAIPGKFGHDLSCLVFVGEFNNACWTVQFNPAVRVFSTLGQPNWFGAYLAVHFFIGLFFVFRDKDKNSKFTQCLYLFYVILNFIMILFTRSRSAIIPVLVGVVLFVGLCLLRAFLKKTELINTLIMALVIFVSVFASLVVFKTGIEKVDRLFMYKTYVQLFSGRQSPDKQEQTQSVRQDEFVVGGVTDSLDIRRIVWKGAIELGKKYPLFGTGVETFAYAYYFVRPQEHNLTSEWDYLYNKAHNEFLNYYATTGLFGLATYLVLIGCVVFLFFRTTWKTKADSDIPLLLTALFFAYGCIQITNLFGFSTTTINILFYLLPVIPLILPVKEQPDKSVEKHRTPLTYSTLTACAFVIIPYILIIIFLLNYWFADTKYAMADTYMKMNDFTTSTTLFEEALNIHYEHVFEDKLSNSFANMAFIASYQKDKEKAEEYMKKAKLFNGKSLDASPYNIVYYKTAAKNSYLFYQISLNRQYIEDGLQALEKAKKIAPTDSKITYYLATYYSMLYDEETNNSKKKNYQNRALLAIDECIVQKPNYIDSYVLKGQLFKKFGMTKQAREVFEFALKKLDPKHDVILKELNSL